MAELNVQPKTGKPMWLWLVLALVVIGVLWFLLRDRDGDGDRIENDMDTTGRTTALVDPAGKLPVNTTFYLRA